ncbi:MAG: hypothetical protein J6A16_09915 [Oscillospiraceae bacterium]|nr:hypothetical protein [Oscillospiraceae bacterium]
MILISGLIPDFSSEAAEIKESKRILMQFQYDNTLEEIDSAMKSFQQKFSGKKHTILLIAYSILTVAAIVLVILDYKNVLPYIALLFCGFNLYYNLTDRKRMRKKVIEAIKETNPEDYTAVIYDDKIEIDTIIKPKEDENIDSDDIGDETQEIVPIKSTFIFGQDMLDFAENDVSLMLIVARRQTYCFPKRCLSKEQQDELRNILKEKTDV